jgi:hypothetical protein
MYIPMDLDDTARVTEPTDAIEYRLGTVVDVDYSTPHTTYVRGYTLRFSNGTMRTYPAEQVVRCTRTDDRAALEAALTVACVKLRDACRIAHDFDADLSDATARLLRGLVGVARLNLGLLLVPENPRWPDLGAGSGDEH